MTKEQKPEATIKRGDAARIVATLKLEKLPYVKVDFSQHGTLRVSVRRNGKAIRLKSEPMTPAFYVEYGIAVGELSAVSPINVSFRTDTLSWLIDEYTRSSRFSVLAYKTKQTRLAQLGHISNEFGDMKFATMNHHDIEKIRAEKLFEGKPFAAEHRRKDLVQVFHHARKMGLTENDPFIGLEPKSENPALRGRAHIGPDGETYSGYWTWTAEQVAQFFDYWPAGTTPHMAMSLLYCLGCRIGDVQQLGPRNVIDGRMIWTTQKAVGRDRVGVPMDLPVLPQLRDAIDAASDSKIISLDHFVLTQFGKPFSRKSLASWFSERAKTAGLPKECSAHGVRKCLATLMAESGATTSELKATFGWKTSRLADLYTDKANKKDLATSGLERFGNVSVSPAAK